MKEKRKTITRAYLKPQEKIDLEKHVEKYGYSSESEFLRIAIKDRVKKDKKT